MTMKGFAAAPVQRRQFIALAAVAAAALAGCAPRWTIISQASPNGLTGARRFAVMPIDFSGLRVGEKDEAGYLSEKDARQRASWARDKEIVNARFLDGLREEAAKHGIDMALATGPGAAPFILRPHVPWMEPGFYTGFVNKPGQAKIEVQILGPQGAPVDVILVEPAGGGFSITDRLSNAGAVGGLFTAKYLAERTGAEQ